MNKLYKRGRNTLFIGLVIILATGCASTYKAVTPSVFAYTNEQIVNDTLKVSYLYNIQGLTRNKRYAKKEKKWAMAAVGIKIENISSSMVALDRDKFKIYSENGEKYSIPISAYTKRVKQNVATHLLHTLWGPWSFSYQEDLSTGETDFKFSIIPVGAVIGIANAAVAGTANTRHRETLERNSIWRQQIHPGKTRYGIILIPAVKQDSLTFSF